MRRNRTRAVAPDEMCVAHGTKFRCQIDWGVDGHNGAVLDEKGAIRWRYAIWAGSEFLLGKIWMAHRFYTANRRRLVRILIGVLVVGALTLSTNAKAQDSAEVLPEVVAHASVTYPPLARQARIQGDVRVRITTDGEAVSAAEAETGNPILRKGAEENVRTWKFAAHRPGTFHVTFRYKLLSGNVDVDFLESPGVVQVGAPPPVVIIDYTNVGLGSWKAEFKTQEGVFTQTLVLYYSGPPEGEWVDGNSVGPKGEKEEIEWGHKDGDYLTFAIALPANDGQRTKTVLLGKMTRNRIVGTFVNDSGMRGVWTAEAEERVKPE